MGGNTDDLTKTERTHRLKYTQGSLGEVEHMSKQLTQQTIITPQEKCKLSTQNMEARFSK